MFSLSLRHINIFEYQLQLRSLSSTQKSFFVFSIRSKIFRESYHCIFSLIKFYDYKVYGTHGDVCLGNNRNERGLFIQQEFDLSPVCSKE